MKKQRGEMLGRATACEIIRVHNWFKVVKYRCFVETWYRIEERTSTLLNSTHLFPYSNVILITAKYLYVFIQTRILELPRVNEPFVWLILVG